MPVITILRIRTLALLALLLTAVALVGTTSAHGQIRGYDDYDPAGVYLDTAESAPFASAWKTRVGKDGIVEFRYAGKAVKHPARIAMYGLQQYSIWVRTKNRAARASAIRHAQWLVRHQDPVTGAWKYPFPYRVGGTKVVLPKGWVSAMAQGQAISLLTRVHRMLPSNPTFLRSARRGLIPLRTHVKQGGTLATFHGRPFFEEYPTTPGTFTLNGFQFTLIGLADLASLGDDRAQRLYRSGEKTLTAFLPFYDAGTTTAYHLGWITMKQPFHQARGYHRTHVMLLRALNHIRPNPVFLSWAHRWSQYPAMRTTSAVTLPESLR